MKKLFIALTAVSIAALSQALTLNWKYASTDVEWVANISSGALVYTDASTADWTKALDAAKGTATEGYGVVSDEGASHWKPELQDALYAEAVLSNGTTAATSGTYFIVLFDAEKTKYAIVDVAASVASSAWTEAKPLENYTGPLTGLQFQGTLVPEPTVLALLALGVAGLALRRKA